MRWNKPLPRPTPISQPWWDGLKAHEVRIQQCTACDAWVFFPRAHCPVCASRQLAWRTVSGHGTLYSFTLARVPTLPEFTDELPQLLAVVQLDEGPHLNTTLLGLPPERWQIGARVRPVFDDRPGEFTLLRYAPEDGDTPAVLRAETPTAAAAPAPVATEAPKRRVSCKDVVAMRALVSDDFGGWSNEFTVTQELIDRFADLSGDDYWIHTDPARAKAQSPFGMTIAQGALVQVLVSQLKLPFDYEVVDFHNMVNYGSDRLRFPTPVPAGCRIHARSRVKAVEAVKSGVLVTQEIDIHVVGQDRPSVINDLLVLYM
ncbi:MAG: acyl dehydratase [Rhodanobacter sp.]|nr:MAG: acyl dehydratase [Rhodanobacter sp.]TAM07758.1 MAG: acyl dehydratase [Rhodanobacter sp.]TAM35905.1 MAG: acyl dehydratase [Rhodanobacter sp.]